MTGGYLVTPLLACGSMGRAGSFALYPIEEAERGGQAHLPSQLWATSDFEEGTQEFMGQRCQPLALSWASLPCGGPGRG